MFRKALFIFLLAPLLLPTAYSAPQSQPSISSGLSTDLIYFVIPDRYKNGDTSNDRGGNDPKSDLSFQPRSTAHFHGGDLKGLTGSCSAGDDGLWRIKELGFTAVWVTPLVTQVEATDSGAGYHGYWGRDFLNVDPHLGSNSDFKDFSSCAKKLGLKVILDVVTNHTGDVISYLGREAYIPKSLAQAKKPDFLNILKNYHNVGSINNCWGDGDCEKLGDFYGLDDLATENEEVVQGWAQVYGKWITEYGLSGFRVDTARHVDDQFFKRWTPLISSQAQTAGVSNFSVFGEVFDFNPVNLIESVRLKKIPSVLDFPLQRAAIEYTSGYSDARVISNIFNFDDQYTSDLTSASNLVTFLGNHDMGRVGYLIQTTRLNPESELTPRIKLAHSLLFFSRGIPTVYYGDEIGMLGSGDGKDQRARQDMFPTEIELWKTEKRAGSSPISERSGFAGDESHPIAQYIKKLSEIRKLNKGLANGVMQIRYAKGPVIVLSKYDQEENREYLVAFNSSNSVQKVTVSPTSTGTWASLLEKVNFKKSSKGLTLTLPKISTIILKSSSPIPSSTSKIKTVNVLVDPYVGDIQLTAVIDKVGIHEVRFSARVEGSSEWKNLGSDFNSPYRVFYYKDTFAPGTGVEIKADLYNNQKKLISSLSRTYNHY